MGNCLGTGENEETDLNPLVTYPGAANIVISDPPPVYESLVPIPPRPPNELSCRTFVAKFDYDSRTDDGLSFKKGDHLYVIGIDAGDRWYAQHQGTNKVGYVPGNFLEPWISLESEE